MAVPGTGDLIGPAACNRTLPIFDGGVRFDITLAFTGDPAGQGRRATPARWRSVRRATSRSPGHRPDRPATKFMTDNKEMEVWLAPVERDALRRALPHLGPVHDRHDGDRGRRTSTISPETKAAAAPALTGGQPSRGLTAGREPSRGRMLLSGTHASRVALKSAWRPAPSILEPRRVRRWQLLWPNVGAPTHVDPGRHIDHDEFLFDRRLRPPGGSGASAAPPGHRRPRARPTPARPISPSSACWRTRPASSACRCGCWRARSMAASSRRPAPKPSR